jgi:hypothetical protein
MVSMEELPTNNFCIKVKLLNLKDTVLRFLQGQLREPGEEHRIFKPH